MLAPRPLPRRVFKGEPMIISDKQQMYRMLAAGDFGNTIPQFFSVDEWAASKDCDRFDMWGVRTLAPGGPCRLNCPRLEVCRTAGDFISAGYGINISCMVDVACNVTLWAEAYDSPAGLIVYGIEYPPKGASWRALMPTQGKHWHGTSAKMLLQKHLNANSLDDLSVLRATYPGHIYEFSALEQCFGTIPHRNAIMWEVRGGARGGY